VPELIFVLDAINLSPQQLTRTESAWRSPAAALHANSTSGACLSLYSHFETMINDVTFGGYRKFGSEAHILPGFEETR
jgi:hypothetical protein